MITVDPEPGKYALLVTDVCNATAFVREGSVLWPGVCFMAGCPFYGQGYVLWPGVCFMARGLFYGWGSVLWLWVRFMAGVPFYVSL